MNKVFRPHLSKFILVFFNDILIHILNLNQHAEHLHIALQLLRHHRLFAKRSECTFVTSRVEYLGHYISAEGVSTDPSKSKAVLEWPLRQNIKQLRGFLGLIGYYRRFIKGHGAIGKPLT